VLGPGESQPVLWFHRERLCTTGKHIALKLTVTVLLLELSETAGPALKGLAGYGVDDTRAAEPGVSVSESAKETKLHRSDRPIPRAAVWTACLFARGTAFLWVQTYESVTSFAIDWLWNMVT